GGAGIPQPAPATDLLRRPAPARQMNLWPRDRHPQEVDRPMHNPRFSDLHDIPPRAFSPAALALQVSPWLLVGLGAWGGLPLWICLFCGVCLSLGLLPALATATHWRALMQPRPLARQLPDWLAPLADELHTQCTQR